MLLNFIVLVASMVVISLVVGIVNIFISTNDVLKAENGKLYCIEYQRMKQDYYSNYFESLDLEKKLDGIKLPGRICLLQKLNFPLIKKGTKKMFYCSSVNKNFSDILNIEFVVGGSLQDKHFKDAQNVAIISEKFARCYFGETDVVGKEIILFRNRHKIVGVFKNLIENMEYYSDVYLPSSAIGGPRSSTYHLLFLSNSENDKKQAEMILNKHITSIIKDGASVRIISLFDKMMQNNGDMILRYIFLIVFCLLLPALLLSNLTIHRMESRLAELGIRKAFGADKKTIYRQLIAENLVFTLLAGIVALLIGQILISNFYYGTFGVGNWLRFDLPLNLFFLILLAFILFGLITGVLPARKVSRQSIIRSLNSN